VNGDFGTSRLRVLVATDNHPPFSLSFFNKVVYFPPSKLQSYTALNKKQQAEKSNGLEKMINCALTHFQRRAAFPAFVWKD
jgi:hypothetical protein